MAIVNGTIVGTGQAITVDLPTARHPELPPIGEISDSDIFTLWDASENKTKSATVDEVRTKINGAPIVSPPVLSGADMEIEITPDLIGEKRIDIVSLAGYNYSLERIGPSGSSRYLTSWFNNLSTGGFELTRDFDEFVEGDVFIAHIFELEGGSTTIPGGGGSGSGLIKGIRAVTSNITVLEDDMGKMLNVMGGVNKLTLTLDDVLNITENSTVDIVTMINNDWQTTVNTTDGQFIYINGEGFLEVYLGIGESLRIVRGDDGWYAMGPILGYLRVGQPFSGFKQVNNSLIAEGQLVNRDSYPRLWWFAQSSGTSLLSDADWLSAGSNDRRGCFSTGNGTTTFRLPDLRGTTDRWLDRGRGLDVNPRAYSMPGSYQPDAVKNFLEDEEFNKLLKPNIGPDTAATFAPGGRGPEWPGIANSKEIIGLQPENTVKSTGFLGLIGT